MPKGMKIEFLFVPFPQDIWDKNVDMTLGEFRLLGYLLRHQMRFAATANQPVKMTDEELLHGRKKKGERYDQGCGLGRNALKDARERLIQKGWITVEEDLRDKARPLRWYLVQLSEEVSNSDTHLSEEDNTLSENDHTLSATNTRSDSRQIKKKVTVDILNGCSASDPDGWVEDQASPALFPDQEHPAETLSKPQQGKKPRPSKADPRSSSPEISLFRKLTHRNPALEDYDFVIACLRGHTKESASPYVRPGMAWLDWAKRNKPANHAPVAAKSWEEQMEEGVRNGTIMKVDDHYEPVVRRNV